MTTALLIELAWKSTLTLGATLIILRLLRHRSAAERSWLAHAGLVATLALPLILLAAPRWNVEAPAPMVVLAAKVAPAASPQLVATADIANADTAIISRHPGESRGPAAATDGLPAIAGIADEANWISALPTAILLYALPAALLLTLTFVAIFRLVGLKRRANVIVENDWLSALAQAQRRMGFKNGTALLVSPDIASPVSWGVMRPVILLNEAAIGSQGQAEAIIAHELAHVARLDWAKLLLARVTAALFWFNPLVWMLTRQCHQLREESADDAVLASDVPDLDYAELLVGVARHESGALLLAANGVAPSRGSLAQRVTRVLDTSLRRAPARLGWTAGVTLGAALFAAPLAALSFGAAPAEAPVSRVALAAQTKATIPATSTSWAAAPAPVVEARPTAAAATAAEAEAAADRPFAAAIANAVELAMSISSVLPAPTPEPRTVVAVAAPAPPAPPAPLPPAPPVKHAVNWAAGSTTIDLPPFTNIAVTGGGTVMLRYGPRQMVRVVGGNADDVTFAVSEDNLAIKGCPGSCKTSVIELVMPVSPEALAIHGGGAIQARGAFPPVSDIAIAVHGGGSIDADAIPADEVAAAIRGGGLIATRARQELAASITGGGAIRYSGDPAISTAVRGGGTVTRSGQ